jgi:hypothetical protein
MTGSMVRSITSGRPWRTAITLLLLACLSPRVASAQSTSATASAPSLAETLKGQAKAEYEAARLLIADGDPAGAAAKFKRAHELSGEPRLLWNMAVCEKELRHYARAATLVDRYLAEGGSRLTAENRKSASETRDALRGFFSALSLTGLPDGTVVLVDGNEVAKAPLTGPVLVDLGTHDLRFEHPAHEPQQQRLEVPGSSEMALAVTLRPIVTTARLVIVASPRESVIRIDGQLRGTGRFDGALPPGRHVVLVTAEGRVDHRAELELLPRQNRTLDVTLAAESGGALWPWIAGGAAVAAGATIGGYFLFRGKDEPGSAPHGQLGTVYLPQVLR